MKKNIFIAFLILLSVKAMSQQNIGILGGGWASANIEDSDTKATGWTIKGSYEFNPQEGMFSHGIGFGYTNVSGTSDMIGVSETLTVGSFPIYYQPKVIFGESKFKIFAKGAIGMQFSSLKREVLITTTSNDFGFYGGGGAGLMYFIKDNIFVNGEYEIAWASNNWYKDGWISTATIGLGFRF